MGEHFTEGRAFCQAAGNRVRQGHADQERKARLNGVVQRATGPGYMRLVPSEKAPEPITGISCGYASQLKDFSHHEQHHPTAISVHGDISGDWLRKRGLLSYCWLLLNRCRLDDACHGHLRL